MQDMHLKARAGIRVGDIQKEAHITFCMALINESKKQHLDAIKYLKRFYFCAKLLDDFEGVEIAFNKIGINFHMAAEYY